MNITIFRNHGCLGAEKRKIYTYGGQAETAVCSDKLLVEIPAGWNLFEGCNGRVMVSAPWGWNYDINEVLTGNEFPYFLAIDKDMKSHKERLVIISECN